jgi:hypothetical protein
MPERTHALSAPVQSFQFQVQVMRNYKRTHSEKGGQDEWDGRSRILPNEPILENPRAESLKSEKLKARNPNRIRNNWDCEVCYNFTKRSHQTRK